MGIITIHLKKNYFKNYFNILPAAFSGWICIKLGAPVCVCRQKASATNFCRTSILYRVKIQHLSLTRVFAVNMTDVHKKGERSLTVQSYR